MECPNNHSYTNVRKTYYGTYILYEEYCTTCGTIIKTWTTLDLGD